MVKVDIKNDEMSTVQAHAETKDDRGLQRGGEGEKRDD